MGGGGATVCYTVYNCNANQSTHQKSLFKGQVLYVTPHPKFSVVRSQIYCPLFVLHPCANYISIINDIKLTQVDNKIEDGKRVVKVM